MDEARSLTYSINVRAIVGQAEEDIRNFIGTLGRLRESGSSDIDIGADTERAEESIRDLTEDIGGLRSDSEDSDIIIDADTSGAEENVRDLTEDIGNLDDADIDVDVDTSGARDEIQDLDDDIGDLESNADSIGDAFRKSFLAGVDGGESFASSIRSGVVGAITQAGNQAGGLGSAFSSSFKAGVDSGGSLATSLRAGVGGALSYVGEQAGELRDNVVEGAKKIGDGFAHPVDTIKNGLGNAVESVKNKFTQMVRGADDATDSTDDLGDAADDAADDMEDLGDATSESGDAAEKSGGKFEKFGTVLKGVGVALLAATTAVTAFATASLGVGMEFDSSMSQVAATMGYSVEELHTAGTEANETYNALRDFAMEMGASTAFSATQAADALNYMALAGYDAETSMQMLPNVLNLAAAGGMELAQASDMVTDAQSALGLTLDETSDLVDKMAMASSKSNTSVSQLGDAILTIGGTAKNLAGGTTELSAALGILADNGIKGAEGGTHLRNVILSLSSPTDTAAKALSSLGVEVFDAEGNMRPLNETLGDLNAAMSDMTQAEQTDIISTIFNKTDISSVNALLSTSSERWDELGLAIDGAWVNMGSLSEALSDVGLDMTTMQSKLGKLGISETAFSNILATSGGNAEDFAGALLEAADAGTSYDDIIGAIGGDLTDLQTAFDNTTGSAQAMADTQLDNLAGDITLFQSALEGAQIVISDALSPTLREFTQFGTEAISTLSTAFQEGGLSGAMGALGTILSDGLSMVIEMLPTLVDAGMQLLGALGQGVLSNLPVLIGAAAQIIVTLASGIGSALPELIPSVVETIFLVASTLLDNLPLILDAGMQILSGFSEGILSALPILVEQLPEIILQMVDFFSENLPTILEQGSQMLLSLGMGIIEALPQLVSQLPQIISSIVGFVTENLPLIVETGVNLIVQLGVGLIQAIPGLVAQLPQIISAIVGGLAELPGMMLDIGKNVVEGLWNGISSMASWAVDKVKEFAGSIVDGIKGFLGIHSPSTVFASIGDNMALGLGEGFGKSMESVAQDMEDSIPTDFDLPAELNFPTGNAPDTNLKGAGGNSNNSDEPAPGKNPPPLPEWPSPVTYDVSPVIEDIKTPAVPDALYGVKPVFEDFNPPDLSVPAEYRMNVVSGEPGEGSEGANAGGGNAAPAPAFAPVITINVQGSVDERTIEDLKSQLYDTVKELYEEFRNQELEQMALKEQYAF